MRLDRVLVLYLIIFVLTTCIPVTGEAQDNAQIVVYLEGAEKINRRIELTIDRVTLQGSTVITDLSALTNKIVSTDLSNRQMMLLEKDIIPGYYTSLTIYFESIKAYAGSADIYPEFSKEGLTIPIGSEILPNSTYALMLFWKPSRYEYDTLFYSPDIKVIEKELPPAGASVFVSNKGSGNISIIDRYSKRVVDVLASGQYPCDMALSANGDQLYVLDSGLHSIEVFDIVQLKTEKKSILSFHDQPSRLQLTPDNVSLFVLMPGSQAVSLFNAFSLQETDRFDISISPSSIAFDPYSSTIFISDMYNNELVKINPQMLPPQATLSIPSALIEIEIDSRSNMIYGAHTTSGTISVLNVQTGALVKSIKICSPANSLAYDNMSQTLYAAMEDCQEIAIMKPNSGFEIGSIRLPSRPGRIFLDNQTRNLLITLPDEGQVAFCNVTTRKITSLIQVGKDPSAIVTP